MTKITNDAVPPSSRSRSSFAETERRGSHGSADAPIKVKDGLYIIRGPAMPCMTGCRPGAGDGLIHESGDVVWRHPDGLIVVDDKLPASRRLRAGEGQPAVCYVLNTYHHADHASGNQYARDTSA